MPTSVVSSLPGSEFHAFLFANIGVERNGMQLSVLSALSRLGVDPWAEAASLSNLPEIAAIRKLTTIIASLPHAPMPPFDLALSSSRLIALLPHHSGNNVSTGETFETLAGSTDIKTIVNAIMIGIVFTSLLLALHFASRTGNKSPQVENTQPL